MTTEESRRTVLEYLDARDRGDLEAIRRLTTEDLRWEPPGSAMAPVEGRDAVLEVFAKASAEFFDVDTMKVEIHKIIAEGDSVAILQSMTCKTVKGDDYSNDYCWVYTCEDGKVKRMQEFTDSKRFDEVMKG